MRSTSFLAKCQALKEAGFSPESEIGMFIGRGFADLGYELFSLIGEDCCVSLFTGQSSQIAEQDKGHFFAVPSADELVNEIQKLEIDIRSLEFKEQRYWQLSALDCRNSRTIELRADSLLDVLADCCLKRLRSEL